MDLRKLPVLEFGVIRPTSTNRKSPRRSACVFESISPRQHRDNCAINLPNTGSPWVAGLVFNLGDTICRRGDVCHSLEAAPGVGRPRSKYNGVPTDYQK